MPKKKTLFIILITLGLLGMIAFLLSWMITYYQLLQTITSREEFINTFMSITTRRSTQLIAIICALALIAASSLVFQTITNNRILTPSVLGFDAIFVITQVVFILVFGSSNVFTSNEYINFIGSVVLMVGVTLLIYALILKKNQNNVVLLILVGMVISSIAMNISSFIQTLMNPDDFAVSQSLTNVSLTNINTNLVYLSAGLMITLMVLFIREFKTYDVMILGESLSINLGVDYQRKVKQSLIYIAIAVSVSTALIGPLSFLGLIGISLSRELFKTNRHLINLFGSLIIMVILILFAQVILELLDHITSVSVIINLIGGIYVIGLLIKKPLQLANQA